MVARRVARKSRMLTDESGLRGCGILGQVLRYGQPATVWVATEDDGFPLPLFVRSTFKAGGDRGREDRDIVCAGVDPGLDRAAGKNVEPFVLPLPPEGLVSGSRRREAEHRVERECGVFGESAEVSLCVVATEFTAGRPRPVHIEGPIDVLTEPWNGAAGAAAPAVPPTRAPKAVRRAAEQLAAAARPVC